MEIFGFNPDDLIISDYEESEIDDMDADKTFEVTEDEMKKIEKQDAIDDDEMGATVVLILIEKA